MSILSGLSLAYSVIIQKINAQNDILSTTPATNVSVPLPQGLAGEVPAFILDGAVDVVLPMIDPTNIDFLVLITDQEISVKLQGAGSTPIIIRAGGMLMLDSKNITSILVSNGSGFDSRVYCQQAKTQTP